MVTLTVAVDDSTEAGRCLRWTTRVAEAIGAKVVEVRVDGGDSPGLVLLDAADRAGADLVVVAGSSSHRQPATSPEGIADYVARHSRRPYAVVPPAATGELPRCVAIGLDGSPGAEAAAAWCASFAAEVGATVVAIDVLHPPAFLTPSLPELHADATQSLAESWTSPFADNGVPVTTVVVDDPEPGRAFLAAAEAAGADALVLGARVIVGVRLLDHDGITLHALDQGQLPVIVIPTDHGLAEHYAAPERSGAFTLPA